VQWLTSPDFFLRFAQHNFKISYASSGSSCKSRRDEEEEEESEEGEETRTEGREVWRF
jgi:hypothetical protein